MKIKHLLTKTLLVAAGLLMTGTNAYGAATRTLTADYAVAGYKYKAYYDLFTSNVGTMCPTTGDCYYRDGYGLYNFKSGNRSATITISVSAGDLIIFEAHQSQTYDDLINSVSSCTKNDKVSTGSYWAYDVTSNETSLTVNITRAEYISAILVMEVDPESKTADYTINYKYSGSTIASEEGTEVIGATVAASSSKWVADVKYLLDGGQTTSMTIVDGENVLNVNVSIAPQYTYSIVAIDENSTELGVAASVTKYSGESSAVYYPKGYNKAGVWYLAAAKAEPYYGYNYTFSASNSENVTYTKDETVNYVFEDSELTFTGYSAGGYPGRYSNGSARRIAKAGYAYTSALENGVYTMIVYSRNNSGSSSVTLPIYIRNTDGTYSSTGKSVTWTKGAANEQTATEIEVPEGAAIAFNNDNADYTSNAEIDYIILKKTAVPVTVSAAGYATYVPSCDLDFSATAIEAYKVKVSSKGVATMTKVDNVPAGTPVLLYKDGGDTENIPVMTGAAGVTGNDLVPGTDAAVATIDGGYTNMILNNKGGNVGFYYANGQTVAANRAYLHFDSSYKPGSGAPMMLVFDNETTGISEIETMRNVENEIFFDLQGRKVAQPTKGLYIVNGKKVIK